MTRLFTVIVIVIVPAKQTEFAAPHLISLCIIVDVAAEKSRTTCSCFTAMLIVMMYPCT